MRLSENVQRLRPSATIAVSTLAKRLTAEGRDIIDLSAGEPDFDTPEFIAEGAIAGIRAGRTRYTPPAGIPALRRAIAEHLGERAGRPLDPDGVVVSTGAKQALFNAAFSLFGPGDEVLVAAPYWTSYPELVKLARAEPVPVAGEPARSFKIGPDDLEKAATPRTRGLIVNTPCNPTGAVYSGDELEALARWAKDRGIWLIVDEIYRRIHHAANDPAPGLLDLPSDALGDFVLVDGASKGFAMTGWRIGFSWCRPELASMFTALQSQLTSNPSTPSQVAALTAFENPDERERAVCTMADAFRRRRDRVVEWMKALLPDIPFIYPEGAFYLFFRVDGLFDEEVQDATAWCTRLLERKGVALVPGAAFGDDRWVRMSYAASEKELEEAVDRLAALVHVAGTTA